MEYAYATCLLNETGEEINETNLSAVLEAAGTDVQHSRVKAIVAALEDVEIDDISSIDLDRITEKRPARDAGAVTAETDPTVADGAALEGSAQDEPPATDSESNEV